MLDLEHLWCNRRQANTMHLGRAVNHTLHLLVTILTGGIWAIGWILVAALGDRSTYCVHCSTPFTKKVSRVEGAAEAL